MTSIPCALFVALLVPLAFAAPSNRTMSDAVMVGQTMSFGDLDSFVVVFGVSPCMASCMKDMRGNRTEEVKEQNPKLQEICDTYLAAAQCFQTCPDGDAQLFDVFSSGATYMCIDKRAEFERAMPCIKDNKETLKQECGMKCKVPEKETDEMEGETLEIPDRPPTWNNETALYKHVGDLCSALQCSIECGRDLLNKRCDADLHVGNLLTEVIIRPLEKNAQYLLSMAPDVEETVDQALPKSCGFIVDPEELNALRGGWTPEDSNLLKPLSSTIKAFSSTSAFPGAETTTLPNQHIQLRRRRSASANVLANSGVLASHAMMYFM